MLQSEFIKQYCDGSKMTEVEILSHGLVAIPCDCEEEICKKWQMVDKNRFLDIWHEGRRAFALSHQLNSSQAL